MNGEEDGAQSRDERIESYYQESAWDLAEWLVDLDDERDRYRLAWLSARRRAALESVYATEALELRDAEIARLKGPRKSTCATSN